MRLKVDSQNMPLIQDTCAICYSQVGFSILWSFRMAEQRACFI